MSRTIRQRRMRERRASRRRKQVVLLLIVLGVIAVAAGAYGTYDYLKGDDATWPSIDNLQPQRIGENSLVLDRDGKLMGYIQSDQNRQNLKYKDMGEWAPKATVAIEDRRFYEHNGVDPEGIARALSVNLESGENSEGASTITQQVIRNLYKEIGTEKKLSRKAKEATLAVQLEQRKGWDKDKILETYLNLVFYGNNAYGIQAASRTYFNKPASDLTIAEAAMLAGLPQSPSKFDPFAVPEKAQSRRDDVLKSMYAQDMISKKEFNTAIATPIKLTAGTTYKIRRLPYFFDYVEQELIGKFGSATVRQGGLRIKTTIDPKMQKIAEDAVKSSLPAGGPSGAIAVLDTQTGQIRAMASTESYSKSKFNRPAQAKRQPGSTAKIWVLASFLRQGVNPDTQTYVSRPIKVRYKGTTEWWEPKTYSGSYSGGMSIRGATVASDNSVYAQMTLDISPEKVSETAHLLGIQSPLEDVWSIGLGSQVVTPLEQTNFYSTIARGGVRIDPRSVSNVVTAGGTKLDPEYTKGRRVLQDWQAEKIVDILHDNVTGGTGTAANISGEDISGKTGTTDDSKDAWFCGMTPELTACVWMGYNIPTPMPGAAGGGIPAQIWRKFMDPALDLTRERSWFGVNGTPAWQPFTSTWLDNPGFDTSVGADPKDAKEEDEKDKDAEAGADDGTTTPAPDGGTGETQTPTDTAPPTTGTPVTTAPPATATPTTGTPAPTG